MYLCERICMILFQDKDGRRPYREGKKKDI